ncbi:MAG: oligosaccharide repeat unit polymerase [Marinobacter sp.]|uniref:oligosaccharide repeat unit polymerase n=1 Tax=Marinobacter sp. TaxID=50741 RepID=UPI001B5EF54E|nr:oligosaccharide repeat unit polymerase [Marinobacter sp.]MBQ0746653.1 oligosaccharide repeat unit polymerase [Marinobacter sp.]MBQ0814216.1 oligosaccharide repeat unit polymerase [Marinobacter sp.]
MVINPFILVFFIYLVSNSYFFVRGVQHGGFELLGDFYVVSSEAYFVAILTIFIVMIMIFLSYVLAIGKVNGKGLQFLSDKKSWLVIIYQLFYITFFLRTGAGVLGAEREITSSLDVGLNYFFKLLSPDILAISAMVFFNSKRLFYISISVFVISMTMRGWMGGVYIAGILVLARFYPVRLSMLPIISFVVLIVFLPFLDALKWGIRGGYDVSVLISSAYDVYSFDVLLRSLEVVFSRFQHINNVALIAQNNIEFKEWFFSSSFRPIIFNGFLYDVFCHLTNTCNMNLNGFIVEKFYDPGGGWNVDPGLSGWLFLGSVNFLSTILVFVFFGVFFPWYLSNRLGFNFLLVIYSLNCVYFLHGWVAPYFNFLFCSFLIFVLIRVRWSGQTTEKTQSRLEKPMPRE